MGIWLNNSVDSADFFNHLAVIPITMVSYCNHGNRNHNIEEQYPIDTAPLYCAKSPKRK
jgi:hypothetical protein